MTSAPKSGRARAARSRQRLGAALVLAGLALATALFWAGVVHLIANA